MKKLNVILITYNQQDYIAKAVESILMQETDFTFNILVADDCSTDSTLSIIKEYAKTSSIEFVPLENKKNIKYIKNYQRIFKVCDADYVAIMEGDDYWTSPNHLANHVNFLEAHPECSMSYNRHNRIFVDEGRESLSDWVAGDEEYRLITTNELALGNLIGNFSCCVYRGELIRKLDSRLFEIENMAEWIIGMYMGQYGLIAHQKQVTSDYLVHSNGQWSKMSDAEQSVAVLNMIDEYDKFFHYKYNKEFDRHRERLRMHVYGEKSLRERIKSITPEFIRKLYRKVIG